MQPYTLHYAPDNASLPVRLALEEMEVPYQTCLIDRENDGHKGADYLKRNPRGLIPVLTTQHGDIFETAAILLWLGDTHGRMCPSPSSAQRGAFLKWLFYASNGLHADLQMLFHPERHAGGPEERDRSHAAVAGRVADHLALFEAVASARSEWLNGEEPSILDCYMVSMLRWMALYPRGMARFDLGAHPSLESLARRMQDRDSARSVAQAEGLGDAPFTAPDYPSPPAECGS